MWKMVAGVTGLEPATSGVTGRRSNQLSYTPEAVGTAAVAGELRDTPRPVKRQIRLQSAFRRAAPAMR